MTESLAKLPSRSRRRPVGGCRNGLTMPRTRPSQPKRLLRRSGLAGVVPPTRQDAYAISMGHYQCSLV